MIWTWEASVPCLCYTGLEGAAVEGWVLSIGRPYTKAQAALLAGDCCCLKHRSLCVGMDICSVCSMVHGKEWASRDAEKVSHRD